MEKVPAVSESSCSCFSFCACPSFLPFLSPSKQSTHVGTKRIVNRRPVASAACLQRVVEPEEIHDVYSPAAGERTQFTREAKPETFPQYLAVHARRFYVGHDWMPKKMDVHLEVPDELNIEHLRAEAPPAGEEEMPKEDDDEQAAKEGQTVDPDPTIVAQLTAMGFSENGCKKAAMAVRNSSAEEAAEWVFQHMEDADFSQPPEGQKGQHQAHEADEEKLSMLSSMGFSKFQCEASLKACNGDIERAADWLFSRAGSNLDEECAVVMGQPQGENSIASPSPFRDEHGPADGPAKYELFAMVSHMGANTSCGHYVCHIKKDGRWVIFNDRKVAESVCPPRELAYMYFFRRKSN